MILERWALLIREKWCRIGMYGGEKIGRRLCFLDSGATEAEDDIITGVDVVSSLPPYSHSDIGTVNTPMYKEGNITRKCHPIRGHESTERESRSALSLTSLSDVGGWVDNVMLRPLYAPERDPIPVVQEAGCAPGLGVPRSWACPRARCAPGRVRKISPAPGLEPRTVWHVASRYTDWAIETSTYV
jgi:hypothetical protein